MFIYKIDYTGEIMSFTVRLELPPDIEFVLELFRRGKISHYELSCALGLDRIETDAYLKKHGVFEGSLSLKDLEADYQTLQNLHSKAP